jgi:peptidoglycan/xylan/chitin deacetylase (PgdA/CDA1 family)
MASTSTLSPGGSARMAAKTRRTILAGVSSSRYKLCALLLTFILLGVWAGTVGTRRLLKLFDKYDIKTTWFIPGHSLETFPEDMAAVRDAGHEIGLHGYSHENPTDMSIEQQRDVLDKTYRMLTEFAGKPPRGSVAPWYVVNNSETRHYNC